MKIKLILFIFLFLNSLWITAQPTVEKWRVFELTLNGTDTGNPFTEVELSADFIHRQETVSVQGFYDGKGIYKVRFMPNLEGEWNYLVHSTSKSFNNKKGQFYCSPSNPGNHGPVVIKDITQLTYTDGKPYYSFGTIRAVCP